MIGFGGGSSHQHFPSWTAPLTRYAFEGNYPEQIDPSGTGLMSDALAGSNVFPGYQAFGGLAGSVPNAQQAGLYGRDLSAQATQQGYGNLMGLGQQAFGPVDQMQGLAGLIDPAMGASNYYLQNVNQAGRGLQDLSGLLPGQRAQAIGGMQGLYDQLPGRGAGAIGGSNVQNAMGAGQQVVNAALGAYHQLPEEAYQRVIQQGLPEVRASYGARGLGDSGMAARGEQDYIQRTRDELFQKDVANQIAALQTGASAAGPAASQAIGAQQAAIGRGQLGLGYGGLQGDLLQQMGQLGLGYDQLGGTLFGQQGQLGLAAAQAPGALLGQFQDVAGAPLGAMGQAAALQGAPLSLLGQGLGTYGQALNLPFAYQQALYNYTRQPQLDLLTQLSGTQQGQNRNWNFSLGGGGGKGGGGGGGGN